ncbi:hypothetical protein P879_02172, partial [Paragonimus westermani]
VFPIGSSTDPVLLVLPHSAIYADLLTAVQQSVLSNYSLWANVEVDSGSSDAARLDQHLRSLQVTDECVQLIVNTWPRQTLPHCSSLSPSSSSTVTQSDLYLTQSLLELGLVDGIGVRVRHCVSGSCPLGDDLSIIKNNPEYSVANPTGRNCLSATSNSAPSDGNLRDETVKKPCDMLDWLRIRVFRIDRSTDPVLLTFPRTAVYADLLTAVQHYVLPNGSSNTNTNSGSVNNPRMQQHLYSLHVTDECVQLIVSTWPRQTLPHCSSLSPSSVGQSNLCLTRSLIDLGLSDGISLHVRHSARCPFQGNVELVGSVQENPSNEPNRNGDLPINHANTTDPRFPPGGEQLVPRPPGCIIPRSRLSVHENIRRAVSRRESEFEGSINKTDTELPPSLWFTPTRLTALCLHRVFDLITRYLDAIASSRIGRHLPAIKDALNCWVINTLSSMHWPEALGHQLICELIQQCRFDVHCAAILSNCVTSLDLSYYKLVTSELVFCLTSRWPHLNELHLNGLQTGQVSVDAISHLSTLRQLRLLNLNGVTAVCDRNIGPIINLPNLRILRVSQTRVTDAGWIQASREPTNDIHRPLFTLEASGLHTQLTHQGLEAIVNLFPQLRRLNVAASNLYVTKSPTTNVLNNLTHLDVSECDQLEYLPSCLTPPHSGCNPSQGLATLRILHCARLNLALVLDQLQAQPIKCMDGLETLHCLDGPLLLRYCMNGFALEELHLRSVNFAWMTQSTNLITEILSALSSSKLKRLSLPQRPIQSPPGAIDLSTVLIQLQQFSELQMLDLGGQVLGEPEFKAVEQVISCLPNINSLIIATLPHQFEQRLREVCPSGCSLRIQHLL